MKPQKLSDVILDDLSRWSNRPSGQSLHEFLAADLTSEELEAAIHSVNQTPKLFQELKEHRARGGNPRAWLGRVFSTLTCQDGSELPSLNQVTLNGVEFSEESPQRLATQMIDLTMGAYSGESSELSEQIVSSIDSLRVNASEPVQQSLEDYFLSEDDTPHSQDITGVLTGSLMKLRRALPEDTKPHIDSIGSIVDQGLYGVKSSIQILRGDQGKCIEDVIIDLEDRAAANLARMARRTTEAALEHGGELVGGVLGGFIGHAELGKVAGKVAGQYAGKIIAPLVEKAAPIVIEGVKSVTKKTLSAVSWGCNKLLSIFS